MMSQCANCHGSNIKMDEPPPWNAPFNQRKTVVFNAVCLECGKRLKREETFNNLDNYIEFTSKYKN